MARAGIYARAVERGEMFERLAYSQGRKRCIGWGRVAGKVVRCKWNALNYGDARDRL